MHETKHSHSSSSVCTRISLTRGIADGVDYKKQAANDVTGAV